MFRKSSDIKIPLRKDFIHVYLPLVWHQYVVNAAQLDVDFEAEVGEGLGGRLHYVLYLHTLGGHSQKCVSNTLHLSWRKTSQTLA